MRIRLVFTGRHYTAAAQLPAELELPEGSDLAAALAAVAPRLAADRALPPTCLVSVSGRHLGTLARHEPFLLREGDELLLVTPMAGG